MTITILTLILLGYMKVTGKTLPGVEKRLNKVKNAKRKPQVSELTSVAEKEVASMDIGKMNRITFQKNRISNPYPKMYSGSLKI